MVAAATWEEREYGEDTADLTPIERVVRRAATAGPSYTCARRTPPCCAGACVNRAPSSTRRKPAPNTNLSFSDPRRGDLLLPTLTARPRAYRRSQNGVRRHHGSRRGPRPGCRARAAPHRSSPTSMDRTVRPVDPASSRTASAPAPFPVRRARPAAPSALRSSTRVLPPLPAVCDPPSALLDSVP